MPLTGIRSLTHDQHRARLAFQQWRTTMFKFRILAAAILIGIAAVFLSTSFVWAKPPLTSAQKKAKDKCIGKFIDDYVNCINAHPDLSINDCAKAAYSGYQVCLKSAGISLAENPPPPLPKHPRTAAPKPSGVSPGSPSPGKIRPRTEALTGPAVANPSPTPTPTPTPTPSPTKAASPTPGSDRS